MIPSPQSRYFNSLFSVEFASLHFLFFPLPVLCLIVFLNGFIVINIPALSLHRAYNPPTSLLGIHLVSISQRTNQAREKTEFSGFHFFAAAATKSLQSCPILCDPIDGSPPGFPVPGILQARTLEWVAISFSNA